MPVRDPVCGMAVNINAAIAREEHQGTTYFFCSAQCRRMFKADPERYVTAASSTGSTASSTTKPKGG